MVSGNLVTRYVESSRVGVVVGLWLIPQRSLSLSPYSRGPGTAMEWALTIVGILGGQAKREEVEGPMCL